MEFLKEWDRRQDDKQGSKHRGGQALAGWAEAFQFTFLHLSTLLNGGGGFHWGGAALLLRLCR